MLISKHRVWSLLLLVCAGCPSSGPSDDLPPAHEDGGLDSAVLTGDAAGPDSSARIDASDAADAHVDAAPRAVDAGTDGGEVDAGPLPGLDARPTGQTCLASDAPARQLSETGCFAGVPAVEVSTLIPFAVQAPLWSDGAEKARFLALPDDLTIQVGEDGDLSFPVGTVLVKTFALLGTKIETRLLMHVESERWVGVTYQWNDTQTDAILLESGKTVTVGSRDWSIPGREQCFECHTQAANISLGPRLDQLNSSLVYPVTGRTANQLDTWNAVGLFASPVASAGVAPLGNYADDSLPAETRARAYLDANCSGCHRPGGPAESYANFLVGATLFEMGVCDALPKAGTFGLENPRVIAPGEPQRSTLIERMRRADASHEPARQVGRMPPLGVTVPDQLGIQLISAWISGLGACPQE